MTTQPDLTTLTQRGAVAWAGVDAQALREGVERKPLTDERLLQHGLDYALMVALSPRDDESPEWSMNDVAQAFVAGAQAAQRFHGIGVDK